MPPSFAFPAASFRLSLHFSAFFFFFFNDTATTEIYTLSLHDALPICRQHVGATAQGEQQIALHHRRKHASQRECAHASRDRKSTRLNSSHMSISYAVFCLKKKKNTKKNYQAKVNIKLARRCTTHITDT